MSTANPSQDAARALTLVAVGDLYIGKPLRHETHPDFRAAVELFRSADVRLANLEFQLLEGHEPGAAAAPGAWAGAPSSFADELKWLGCQAVSTANNHAGDYGSEGVESTRNALHRRGILQAGTGGNLASAREAAFVDTPAGRVAMLAVSASHLGHARAGRQRDDMRGRPGVAPLRFGTRYRVDGPAFAALLRIERQLMPSGLAGHRERPLERVYDREREGEQLELLGRQFVRGDDFGIESWAAEDDMADLEAAIRAARHRADRVVLQLHSHEYDVEAAMPAAFAVECARRAIDAGADAVIGHGAHGVRGIELHAGRPIFHGIGAFVFQPYLFPRQPADFHEAYGMRDAPLVEVYAQRREKAGFYKHRTHWEALMVHLRFDEHGAPPAVEVHPVTLWPDAAGAPDGLPHLACNADGLALLDKVRELSGRLGTPMHVDRSAHVLRIGADNH